MNDVLGKALHNGEGCNVICESSFYMQLISCTALHTSNCIESTLDPGSMTL